LGLHGYIKKRSVIEFEFKIYYAAMNAQIEIDLDKNRPLNPSQSLSFPLIPSHSLSFCRVSASWIVLPRVDLCRLADPTVTDGPVVEIARFGLDDEYISFEIGPHSACYLGACVCVRARLCARARVRACAPVRLCARVLCVRVCVIFLKDPKKTGFMTVLDLQMLTCQRLDAQVSI